MKMKVETDVMVHHCPFCAEGKNIELIEKKPSEWSVHCMKCDAFGPNSIISKYDAIQAWNKRKNTTLARDIGLYGK